VLKRQADPDRLGKFPNQDLLEVLPNLPEAVQTFPCAQ